MQNGSGLMVLLYGYSLLYTLSGIFAYSLNAYQVFGIALVCYALDKVVFKSLRSFLTVTGTLVVMTGTSVYLLYRMEQLELIWTTLKDFFKVYYLSIAVKSVAIESFHQIVALFLIGILLIVVLDRFIRFKKDNYPYLIALTVVLVVVGYLTKSMGGTRDREAFLILSSTLIVYYFYSFYYEFTDFRRKFTPFVTTIVMFIVIVVVGARLLYVIDPRPLTQEKRKVAFQLSEDVALERPELNKINYFKKENTEIASSFEHDNIELLRIRTEGVRYLKADTYELYFDGVWSRSKELPYLDGDGDGIHKSKAYDQIDYEKYYTIEETRIVMSNLNTNVLLMNNYGAYETRFFDNLRVMNDTRRGIYFSNDVLPDRYVYEFDSILPEYGSPYFDNLVRATANEPYPVALDQLVGEVPDRYKDIQLLAETITQGIENNYDKALAIEQYLTQNYTYNEQPAIPPEGADPINYFLFESKEGFCQQFATSYVLMTRSLGLPSRYAVGFYVAQRDIEPIDYQEALQMEFIDDGVFSVYDSNAHTWPEVYFEEVGWIMFEPTPGRYYKQDVVDYDPYDFQVTEEQQEDGFSLHIEAVTIYIFVGVVLLIGFLTLLLLIIRMRMRLKRKTNVEKLFTIHQLMRRYLKVSGLPKLSYESPREYAQRVDEYMFDLKGISMESLMKDYEGVMYGGYDLDSLESHVQYLTSLRGRMVRRMNRFNYLRVKVIEFFVLNG